MPAVDSPSTESVGQPMKTTTATSGGITHSPGRARRGAGAGPSGSEAGLLDVNPSTPMPLLHRTTHDTGDRPVERVRSLFRGDRVSFTTELRQVGRRPVVDPLTSTILEDRR